MNKPKIYLAGPDVFAPNSIEIGDIRKRICNSHGYTGLYPLDNCINENTPEATAKTIVKANMKMIEDCDFVLANLNNFRGTSKNPQCDSGTAWECGYAIALNKKVIAYTNNINSIPLIILNNIDLAIMNTQFNDLFNYLKNIIFKSYHKDFTIPLSLPLDPTFPDIKDADAISAFILGYKCGKKLPCYASIRDTRTQIEKYGIFDENGYYVENFGHSVNIMIACNSKIYNENTNPED